jgi:4a-hydroxytetrahydrobiopterin dehydratase
MNSGILSREEIASALGDLPGWTADQDRLVKEFDFSSFREAVSFIVRLSFEAEQRDHHPEIRNVYNRVWIALSTHDAGNRVTQKDIDLARALEHFCWL